MPRNGSGVHSLPAGYLAVTGETITATQHNSPLEDLSSEITASLPRNGAAPMTANLPMGTFKLTGLGAGSAATDSATLAQVQSGIVQQATSVGGTADAITLTVSPAITAYTSGYRVRWVSGGANTVTGPTVNVSSLGTKTVKKGAGAALVAGDLGASGFIHEAVYNGTDFILLNPAKTANVGENNTFTGNNTFSGDNTFTGAIISALGHLVSPGGRLTLTTATPVLTSDVTGASTVYYTPYRNAAIALYDGTNWKIHTFSEMSQALSDDTKSPAAATTDSLYDLFVWNDSGTLRCTRGPAWSSATARGTGAGTTELERVNGVWMNKIAITNGPAAQRGVYVGTIATNGSTQLAMMIAPSAAAGGSANRLDVWNMYNRVDVRAVCRDSTNTWNYTTATFRSANNSTSNRITAVFGLNEEAVAAEYYALAGNATNGVVFTSGVGLDATNAFSGVTGGNMSNSTSATSCPSAYKGLPGLGRHFFQALEYSEASGTTTWTGDGGGSVVQSGLFLSCRM